MIDIAVWRKKQGFCTLLQLASNCLVASVCVQTEKCASYRYQQHLCCLENRSGHNRLQLFCSRKCAHTRTSPAGLGLQWVKFVRVWSVTRRTWPILAWLVRAFGGARLAAGLLLARTCVGGPKPDSRIHTATNTDSASFVTNRRNHVGYHVWNIHESWLFDKVFAGSVAGSQRRLFQQDKTGWGLGFTRTVN